MGRRRGCGGPSGEDGASWGAGGAFGFAENLLLSLLRGGVVIRVGRRGLWRKAAFCLLVVRGFGGFGAWLLRSCVMGGRASILSNAVRILDLRPPFLADTRRRHLAPGGQRDGDPVGLRIGGGGEDVAL